MTIDIFERITELRAIAAQEKIVTIPLEEISFDSHWVEERNNVRKEVVRDAEFFALVADIQASRIKQNVSLRLCISPDEQSYCLLCVSGQRRVAAVKQAIANLQMMGDTKSLAQAKKLSQVPAIITEYSSTALAQEDSLIENLLRADLPFLDTAQGFNVLLQRKVSEGMTEKDARVAIGARFGKKADTVRQYIKASRFPDKVLGLFRQYPEIFTVKVIFEHFTGKRIHTDAQIIGLVEDYLRKNAEPAQTSADRAITQPTAEQQADVSVLPPKLVPKKPRNDKGFCKGIAKLVRAKSPVKIGVKGDRGKGKVEISWHSEAELNSLLEWLLRK